MEHRGIGDKAAMHAEFVQPLPIARGRADAVILRQKAVEGGVGEIGFGKVAKARVDLKGLAVGKREGNAADVTVKAELCPLHVFVPFHLKEPSAYHRSHRRCGGIFLRQGERGTSFTQGCKGLGILGQAVHKLCEDVFIEAVKLVLHHLGVAGIEAEDEIVIGIAGADLPIRAAEAEGIVLAAPHQVRIALLPVIVTHGATGGEGIDVLGGGLLHPFLAEDALTVKDTAVHIALTEAGKLLLTKAQRAVSDRHTFIVTDVIGIKPQLIEEARLQIVHHIHPRDLFDDGGKDIRIGVFVFKDLGTVLPEGGGKEVALQIGRGDLKIRVGKHLFGMPVRHIQKPADRYFHRAGIGILGKVFGEILRDRIVKPQKPLLYRKPDGGGRKGLGAGLDHVRLITEGGKKALGHDLFVANDRKAVRFLIRYVLAHGIDQAFDGRAGDTDRLGCCILKVFFRHSRILTNMLSVLFYHVAPVL